MRNFVWIVGTEFVDCDGCQRRWTTVEQATRTHWKKKTSFGHCWIVTAMSVVDAVPELLASGLPVFLEWEWELMLTLEQPERLARWKAREKACAAEVKYRAVLPRDSWNGDAALKKAMVAA